MLGREAPELRPTYNQTQLPKNNNQAVLGAKIENKNTLPPDPGRDRPQTSDLLREMTVWTLPRDPLGEVGQGQN
jgi:hypothetical protein